MCYDATEVILHVVDFFFKMTSILNWSSLSWAFFKLLWVNKWQNIGSFVNDVISPNKRENTFSKSFPDKFDKISNFAFQY